MAKKNSTAPKKAMIFNSVLMINTDNVVSLANSLPKCRMSEDSFNSFMKNNFYFGGKFHGNDFNEGSHYSTVVRQLGLYHILDNEFIPRFYSCINEKEAESYLRYWLKLYVAPNPTSQASFRKTMVVPKYFLKELILFIENNPMIKNIYDIVDKIYDQEFSRNDKGNLPNIIRKYSDCIVVDENNNVSLTPNYKQVMMDINELINNPNRYFEHFGGCKEMPPINVSGQPLQQIFYGAPGTGKSFKIDKDTKGYEVVRTTFHPDSDYSTFVGAYKPVMEDVEKQVVPVVFNNSTFGFDTNNGSFKERRIAYKFVKQAFLKAYLGAWKKYAEQKTVQVSVDAGNGEKWILKSVDDTRVDAQKESRINIKKFEEQVKEFWNKTSNDVGTQDHWRATACKWYREQNSNVQNHTADECWNAILQDLNSGKTISATPVESINGKKGQTYHIKKDENGDIVINNDNQGAKRDEIEKQYNKYKESDTSISIQVSIARKLKEFSDDNFEEAWNALKERVNNIIAPQFLIIEEINRGNCAQIFGDLFQLLDRSDNGFSTYPIEADCDIIDEVARAFKEDKEYKLSSNISIEGAVKGYTSNYGATLSKDVQEGRILLLPPNLYIWATMNTSDQSLFPIDSAFKRRWDWKYIPINTQKEKWFIEAESAKYSWSTFLEKINDIINEKTSSEDKQLGFYFCKAKENIIDAETFVSKVVFYLWNDVFKDYGFDGEYFADPDGGSLEFRKFFNPDGTINEKKVTAFMTNLKIDVEDGDNNTTSDLMITYEGENIEGKYAIDRFLEVLKRAISDKGADAVNNCLQSSEFTQSPDKGTTREYEEINGTGWYLATNISKNNMRKHLSKLKENLGINIDYL